QVVTNGDARPLTGDTLRETQQTITDRIRMDYNTFINSALLLQGRADEFSNQTPGERKRILSEILGLSLYDQLENKAKERLRDVELE
ncbi:MAG: SMC family ATPase, partial [Anaerolineae bacterium]|nr:SMC family ATPase [Anaerolineae bacterium]NIN94365.1 SMC family ATPase [Anaerolineae bacterium]NIQ77429.1 SMC family ATPase [Anaerolineae bacterium]